jgi:hypothetical protein
MNNELPFLTTGRKKKNVHVSNPDSPGDLQIQVGDMMRHLYVDNPHCKYHAATVVAKDGESLVTLEGHVSKDLMRPEFLIRRGVVGFAQEEIRGGYGDVVEITPLESLNPETVESEREDFVRRYRRMMGEDVDLGFGTAASNLGITRTDEYRRRRRLERIRRRRWLEKVNEKWNQSLSVGRTTVNNSREGNAYITDEML